MDFGYIRVSTRDQNEDRQRIAMREAGVDEGHIFADRQSGKDFDRPGYRRLMKKAEAGRHARNKEHRPVGTQLQ